MDKQSADHEVLFIRVPRALKDKLRNLAKGRSLNSLAVERLERDVPPPLAVKWLAMQRDVEEMARDLLERRVLALSSEAELKLAVEALQADVLKDREARSNQPLVAERTQRENQQMVEALGREAKYTPGHFDVLPGASVANPGKVDQLNEPERRRLNLHRALEGRRRGIKSSLAKAIGLTRSRLSHVLAPPSHASHRPLGAEKARKIEEFLELQHGELDEIFRKQDEVRELRDSQEHYERMARILSNLENPAR